MLQVEEAQARVLAEVGLHGTETVALEESLGRILREDVVATADLPQSDNSAMDGYAVRAADIASVPVRLPVTGDIPAGHPAANVLEPGTAMRIMTGAYVPEGADTVVQVELTDGGTEQVSIERAVPRGTNIRKRGEDMRAGARILVSGSRIGPAEVALLAAAQKSAVAVSRLPTVSILSTGDELVDPGEPLLPGKIVNTNGHLLAALCRDAGAIPRMLGIVRDTREDTIAAIQTAAESDFIISSGGVSVGAYDYIKDALDAIGATTMFWRVAMKPGKPVVLSRVRGRLMFGLPGNPASCFVSFHLFVAPALRKAAGEAGPHVPPMVRARLTAPLRSAGDRRLYARVRLESAEGELRETPLATQGSGALTSMAGANGLAIVPQGTTGVAAGESVDCVVIGRL